MRSGERLVYLRPDDTKYILHTPPTRVVTSEEGFGTPPLEYVTDRAPFQHGDTVRSFHLQPRPVQIVTLHNYCSRADYWRGRASLLDALRPNRITDFNNPGKLLYYLATGQKRQLDVFLEAGPGFAPAQQGWREWSFTEVLRFVAHDPAWYDPSSQSVVFTSAVTGTFPLTFPMIFASFGDSVNVQYDGTWLEYPSFVVNGPISGFHIHNHTTDDSLELAYALPAGLSLTITLRGQKSITRSDGLNLLPYLTPDSDLTTFSLAPDPVAPGGVNDLHVTGSGVGVGTSVTMTYYNRYIGI